MVGDAVTRGPRTATPGVPETLSQPSGFQKGFKRRRLGLQTLASVAVTLIVIAFFVSRFEIDLGLLWQKISGANPMIYVLAVGIHYFSFLLRGIRWRMLVQKAGVDEASGQTIPSTMRCTEGVIVSWAINSVALFRLGEVYRSYALKQDSGLPFSKGMGTVLAERIVDIFVVFSLLAISTVAILGGSDGNRGWIILGAAFGLVVTAVAGLFAMRYFEKHLLRLLRPKLQAWYYQFHHSAFRSMRQSPSFYALSITIWLMEVLRLLLILYAVNLHGSIELPYGMLLLFVLFAALTHSLLSTIPITPGGLGFVEVGLAAVLAMQMSYQDGLTVALVERSITYLSLIMVGGLVLLIREFRVRRRQRPSNVALREAS